VDDCSPYLLDDLRLGVADGAYRLLINGDPVRQHARVVRSTAGQRYTFVQPEQPEWPWPVFHQDCHVLYQVAEFRGQPVERGRDHLLERLWVDTDHQSIVRQGA